MSEFRPEARKWQFLRMSSTNLAKKSPERLVRGRAAFKLQCVTTATFSSSTRKISRTCLKHNLTTAFRLFVVGGHGRNHYTNWQKSLSTEITAYLNSTLSKSSQMHDTYQRSCFLLGRSFVHCSQNNHFALRLHTTKCEKNVAKKNSDVRKKRFALEFLY